MEKFISYEKLSKKKKRERDLMQRNTWGDINPVTRRSKNAKVYDRKRPRRWMDEHPDGEGFLLSDGG